MYSKGLNQQEVRELVEYIKENNSWYNLYETHARGRKAVKYYTMRYDTRTNDMWAIEFHEISGVGFYYKPDDVIRIRTENDKDFKSEIYKWLDEVVSEK